MEGQSLFFLSWPNWANWLKTAPAFSPRRLLSRPLVPERVRDMLNQVNLESRCAPVVLGLWLVSKRGPEAVQRGRKPLSIPTVCVEHRFWLRATADHLRRERRRGRGLVRLAGEPRAARISRGESYVKQTQQSRLAQYVTSSIRQRAGTTANERGENSRHKRRGCPTHP